VQKFLMIQNIDNVNPKTSFSKSLNGPLAFPSCGPKVAIWNELFSPTVNTQLSQYYSTMPDFQVGKAVPEFPLLQ
jgi:hypothetical protein